VRVKGEGSGGKVRSDGRGRVNKRGFRPES
jgi:hypothetical protein